MNYVVYRPGDQLKSDCLFKETENIAPIRSIHLVSPLGRNPRPTGRITSLHPQHPAWSHTQKRPRAGAHGTRRQTYNLTEEEGRILME